MKQIVLIIITTFTFMHINAQYQEYENTYEEVSYNGKTYEKVLPEIKRQLEYLDNNWTAEEHNLKMNLKFSEKTKFLNSYYDAAYGNIYIGELIICKIKVYPSEYNNINEPNKLWFYGSLTDSNTSFNGFIIINQFDPNDDVNKTITFEIKQITSFTDTGFISTTDYLLNEAPEELKNDIPQVLLNNNPVTFLPEVLEAP